MLTARRDLFASRSSSVTVVPCAVGSPRREETEAFIRSVFSRHHGADVSSFAPNLLRFEENGRLVAATGWRAAASEPLFLERYLDQPIEQALAQLANRSVSRARIVEVGNLAAEKQGGTLQVVVALATQLQQLGYEWVVFTATRDLLGIFARLGLPLLALDRKSVV